MNYNIETFISLLVDKIAKNLSIVTKEELGQNYMLHISPEKMHNKAYIPWISRRQSNMEDRTVPRITVAPTLLGCYVGYAQLFKQFLNYDPSTNSSYKQGLYIHELEFDKALKPNTKLVYDQKNSDEHWLVTYDEDTKQYKGRMIGKLFVHEIRTRSLSGKISSSSATIYAEINKPEGIRLSKNIFLEKGYWKIEGIEEIEFTAWDKDSKLTVSEISHSEYMSVKDLSAAMLSLTTDKPAFSKW